jgi:hypothetical protein
VRRVYQNDEKIIEDLLGKIKYTLFFKTIIIQRLRKWCFTITIATLFHYYAILKIRLRFYMFLLTHMFFTIFYYM